MAWASYLEPVFSKKLNRYTSGEPISRERYNWIQENQAKLANNHNPDLTDEQITYLLLVKAYPGKADKASQAAPETATGHLLHEGVLQGKMSSLPRNDQ